MQFKLVKFKSDYADEFDVYGLKVYNEEEFAKFNEDLNKIKYPVEHYFGTNEAVEFYNKDSLLKKYEISDITEDQYNFVKKAIHGYGDSYATYVGPEEILEQQADDEAYDG